MREELKPRYLLQTIWNHLRLRFPKGDQLEYNILQKLSYLSVSGILAPLMLLSGWAILLILRQMRAEDCVGHIRCRRCVSCGDGYVRRSDKKGEEMVAVEPHASAR